MKRVHTQDPINIRRHNTKFSIPGELGPDICAPTPKG